MFNRSAKSYCPECGATCNKIYLLEWKMCVDCYMENKGIFWSDFF